MYKLNDSQGRTIKAIKDNVSKSEDGKYNLPYEVALGVDLLVRMVLAKEHAIIINHDSKNFPVIAFSRAIKLGPIVEKTEPKFTLSILPVKGKLKGFPHFNDVYNNFFELEPGATKVYIDAVHSDYCKGEWEERKMKMRKGYKAWIPRVCAKYGLKAPTNSEENKKFHEELDEIRKKERQKQREEYEMEEQRKAGIGEVLANGTVIKEMRVDKKDIIELMKSKMIAKINEEKAIVRKAIQDLETVTNKQWQEQLAYIQKAVKEQTKTIVEAMNKGIAAMGFKQKVCAEFSTGCLNNEEIENLNNGKVIVTISNDMKGGEKAGTKLLRHRMMIGCGADSPFELLAMMNDMDSPSGSGICVIKKTVEVKLPKEFLEMRKVRQANWKEKEALERQINDLCDKARKVDTDAVAFTAMLTEQVLEASADGKKVLEMVNSIVNTNMKALPEAQN